MPVSPDSTPLPPPPARAEHIRLIRGTYRNPSSSSSAISTSDPRNNHHRPNGIHHHHHAKLLPPIVQSTTCKSTISSLLLSTFTNTTTHHHHTDTSNGNTSNTRTINNLLLGNDTTSRNKKKKKSFKNSGLRGLGCTAQPQVSVPAAVIRSAADWGDDDDDNNNNNNRVRSNKEVSSDSKKKKSKLKLKKKEREIESSGGGLEDVWCGPGMIGFSGLVSDDFVAASTRPVVMVNSNNNHHNHSNSGSRGKIDVDKSGGGGGSSTSHHHHHQIQRGERSSSVYSSSISRQQQRERERERGGGGNIDQFADLDLVDSSFEISDIFETPAPLSSYHHLRSRYTDGLSEFLMFQNGILGGARSSGLGLDRYRDLRLDIENMSYEQLLELSDKIGYVSTGLKEDQMGRCIMKSKFDKSTSSKVDVKCSVCQEEFETGDETGKLVCGHAYHLQCIKQWLSHKNACPVCKASASGR